MTIRENLEVLEQKMLSPYASLAKNSRGRTKEDDLCSVRTIYQQDRDRIIHSKAFRRLKHKTQVFLLPEGDHYRTRLTHTLEVSQIARTIAKALRLNEDLVEAIALGHDLGHTPFGHAGERALDSIMPDGFRHYEQSVRVVEKLEKNLNGLNLSFEVIDGILCHTKGREADTIEGRLVRIADRIAYINHDIDDSERAGILAGECIPERAIKFLGKRCTQRINTLVISLIENSFNSELKMSGDIEDAFKDLYDFMYKKVYNNVLAKSEEKKVPGLIRGIYNFFVKNPNRLPKDMICIADTEGGPRAVCDYIAGMTDNFAILKFNEIYIPKPWDFH